MNVTLLFSLQRYEEIHWAYIRGLERRVEQGEPIDASTRWRASSSPGSTPPSTSCCRTARRSAARRRWATPRWPTSGISRSSTIRGGRRSSPDGATRQRPLWASTGTKNPEYSDVLYVESLIGPETVNTMPDQTVEAFQDHGKVERRSTATSTGRGTCSAAEGRRHRSRRRHPQARGRGCQVVLRLVRLADRDDLRPALRRRRARCRVTPPGGRRRCMPSLRGRRTIRCASACGWAAPASRPCSRSSAPPATWPSASCCRGSTTWRSAACCRPSSRWSAMRGRGCRTRRFAASPARPSSRTRGRRSMRSSGRRSPPCSITTPAASTTPVTSTS